MKKMKVFLHLSSSEYVTDKKKKKSNRDDQDGIGLEAKTFWKEYKGLEKQ